MCRQRRFKGQLTIHVDSAAWNLKCPRARKTLNLREAAALRHVHPEQLRTRAKRGLIPGAKIGRRWVLIEIDLAEGSGASRGVG